MNNKLKLFDPAHPSDPSDRSNSLDPSSVQTEILNLERQICQQWLSLGQHDQDQVRDTVQNALKSLIEYRRQPCLTKCKLEILKADFDHIRSSSSMHIGDILWTLVEKYNETQSIVDKFDPKTAVQSPRKKAIKQEAGASKSFLETNGHSSSWSSSSPRSPLSLPPPLPVSVEHVKFEEPMPSDYFASGSNLDAIITHNRLDTYRKLYDGIQRMEAKFAAEFERLGITLRRKHNKTKERVFTLVSEFMYLSQRVETSLGRMRDLESNINQLHSEVSEEQNDCNQAIILKLQHALKVLNQQIEMSDINYANTQQQQQQQQQFNQSIIEQSYSAVNLFDEPSSTLDQNFFKDDFKGRFRPYCPSQLTQASHPSQPPPASATSFSGQQVYTPFYNGGNAYDYDNSPINQNFSVQKGAMLLPRSSLLPPPPPPPSSSQPQYHHQPPSYANSYANTPHPPFNRSFDSLSSPQSMNKDFVDKIDQTTNSFNEPINSFGKFEEKNSNKVEKFEKPSQGFIYKQTDSARFTLAFPPYPPSTIPSDCVKQENNFDF